MTTIARPELEGLERYKFGWADSDEAGASARRGLNEDVVRDISAKKDEPDWMLDLRLKGLRLFGRKPLPTWGSDLSGIDFDHIKYFVRSTEKQAANWDELPADIKSTYDKLGIPEAETEAFARLLGTPVQRLATISRGDGICTTHVTAAALVHTATTTPTS
jgi:Fe-S cluster assembly protein SufB